MTFVDILLRFLTGYELRLTLGLFLFSTKMKKRDHFWLRILIFLPFLFFELIFYAFGINLYFTLSFGWFSYMLLLELGVSLAMILFCYQIDWKRLLYIGAGAYSFQNMIQALFTFTIRTTRFYDSKLNWLVYMAYLIAFWSVLYFGVLRRKWFVTSGRMNALPFIVEIALCLSILHVYSCYITFGTRSGSQIYLPLSIISGLIIVILILTMKANVRVTEKEILERLLIEKGKQYKISQDSMNLINQKAHDLKNILSFMENNSEGKVHEEVKEIEESIMKYDSLVRTGNDTVDLVLSEKKFYCMNNGINFSCIVDGSLFNSMSEIDIYTFLTNALDNAIEATSLIEEKDKRNITINVLKVGEMVKIRVENSFKVKPVFVSGMPITTKSDKKYHGFGVQSMKTTIKKYNGYFNIFVKDEKFVLSATIPL